MADELIDVVDPATGAVIESRPRSEVHSRGLWHQVFHCLVLRPSTGTVVLQRRSTAKAAFPDKLDLSATGHLAAGESPQEGLRELREELGIDPDPEAMVALGTRLLADDGGEAVNRELVHLYFLADDRPLDTYRPFVGEVSELVEVKADDLLDLTVDPVLRIEATTWSLEDGYRETTIERNDLVADAGQYWVVVAVMASRFLRGETPLAI